MIDEAATFGMFGYTSDELKPRSGKKVVAICDECGKIRHIRKFQYRDLCITCSRRTKEYRCRVSQRSLGNSYSAGRVASLETREKMSAAKKGITDTTRQKMSAAKQGIPYNKWNGYAGDQMYCHKFNSSCRESNREKYGRGCFLCGKNEKDNNERLSVHHVDMSKSQGCDGEEWKLVPLCHACHTRAHNLMWKARIEYLLRVVWV